MAVSRRIGAVIVTAFCLTSLPASADAGGSWLELRRKGAKAVVEASRKAATGESWRATWKLDVPATHPLHGLTIEMSRLKAGAGKAKKPRLATTVRLTGNKALAGAGLASVGEQLWLKLPGQARAMPAKGTLLFKPLPVLHVSLALLAGLELSAFYELTLEGEFGGTAVFIMQPRYTKGTGLKRMKLGVSKKYHTPTVVEVSGRRGQYLQRLLWLETRLEGELMVARKLRIRTRSPQQTLDFLLQSLERGKPVSKQRTGKAAL